MSAKKKKKRLLKSRPQQRKKVPSKKGPKPKGKAARPSRPAPKAKGPDKRKGLRGSKKRAETIRRQRISKALKAYNRKKKTAKVFLEGDTKRDRAWGEKLAKEAERAKKQARKAPPKVKSKIHVPATLPKGFTNIAKDKVERIEEALKNALSILSSPATQEALGIKQPLNADVRAHVNADGSFDAELIIKSIPKGLTMRELSIYVEGIVRGVPGAFISIGFRSSHSAEYTKENYNRVRGKVQVQTHYHRSTKKAIAFTHAREIDATLIDRKYHKPEDFFVRLHWNEFGIKPKRKS
jgi:hypothetical protein